MADDKKSVSFSKEHLSIQNPPKSEGGYEQNQSETPKSEIPNNSNNELTPDPRANFTERE
jgi:hypothetical protein